MTLLDEATKLYRGADIEFPDNMPVLECECRYKNKPVILCEAFLAPGSKLRIKCPRCGEFQVFETKG